MMVNEPLFFTMCFQPLRKISNAFPVVIDMT